MIMEVKLLKSCFLMIRDVVEIIAVKKVTLLQGLSKEIM